MDECPCGSGHGLASCCEPYLSGAAQPPTAEALMRARYTAHTKADIDYIQRTHDPDTSEDIDRELTERWARRATWLGLEIRATEAGAADDDVGAVEFVVHYRERGERRLYHELARFRRCEGDWVYVDGEPPEAQTIRRDSPRVGRNDPCACGSGRKHKKCCGAPA